MENKKVYLKVVDQGMAVVVVGIVDEIVHTLFPVRFNDAIARGLDFDAEPATAEGLVESLNKCTAFEGKTGEYSIITEEEFNKFKEEDPQHTTVLDMEMFK